MPSKDETVRKLRQQKTMKMVALNPEATKKIIRSHDISLRKNLAFGYDKLGMTRFKWEGMKAEKVGEAWAFVAHYKYSMPIKVAKLKREERWNETYIKIYHQGEAVAITLGYSEDHPEQAAIISNILNSIKIAPSQDSDKKNIPVEFIFGDGEVKSVSSQSAFIRIDEKVSVEEIKKRFSGFKIVTDTEPNEECEGCIFVKKGEAEISIHFDYNSKAVKEIRSFSPGTGDISGSAFGGSLQAASGKDNVNCGGGYWGYLCQSKDVEGLDYLIGELDRDCTIDWKVGRGTSIPACASIAGFFLSDVSATIIQRWYDANEKCRGGPGNKHETHEWCKTRDTISAELAKKDWCYGKNGEASYQHAWHKCIVNSVRN